MRDAFIKELLSIARSDEKVILITADLGFGVLDDFRKELPSQFINVGVAEQNMVGIATGLALEGYIVYCYSIGNFSTLRCLEQIRNDAAYHDANVKIISVGGGFSYGPLGMSHHATEDIAILRALPGVKVIVPSTLKEAAESAKFLKDQNGVVYLRLDKSYAEVDNKKAITDFDKWQVVREGSKVCLITTGGILQESILAARSLESHGLDVKLISAINLTPSTPKVILENIGNCNLVVTIEEHVKVGGLGGLVAECIAENTKGITLLRLGLDNSKVSSVGSQQYLRRISGISAEGIVGSTLNAISNSKI
jgi:transketolase